MSDSKLGRKRIVIDWDEVAKLITYHCTQIEIADFFECSVDTLERACLRDNGLSFADYFSRYKSVGKIRLRKAMLENVEKARPGWSNCATYLHRLYFKDERPRQDNAPEPEPEPEPEVITPLATAGVKSFQEFCRDAGYPSPYPKQIEMRDFGLTETDPRLLLGSRGYGKTDYVTILGVAYEVYLDYMLNKESKTFTESNLIISKSKTRNTAMIEESAAALKANGVPLEKENSTCIRVEGLIGKDHSIEVLTIKSTFRGRHPKRIIMDDPVTEEDVSDAMRILVKRKYDEALKLCKNVCIIGQPAHAFDLYSELRPTLLLLEVPHGTIPELDHDLEAMKLAGVDAHSIEMSYHLRIPQDGSSIFAGLKYIDKFPDGDSVAFIDPSDGGDYTAMSIVKGYFDGVAAVGYARKKAWYHCIDEFIPILRARGVRKLCFETNATGSQPIEQLRAALSQYGIGVVGKHSDTNKHAVIQSAGVYAQLIHLSKESDRIYTEQVTKYEYGAKFDDSPDSLARCLEWLGLIRGKK